ncbi:sulfatase domain-containing protein [Ditylenchus destructor]|nr:sulfatase domain-containing protein [Ditylenchus destructor]
MFTAHLLFLLLIFPIDGELHNKKQEISDIPDDKLYQAATPERPNIVVLMVDDLGYGDLTSYGNPSQEFSPVDKLMQEGTRFTNAYSADSMCSPRRLPIRLGIWGDKRRVFTPNVTGALPKNETTLAEMLKENGYVTGMIGKWHLGINHKTNRDGLHLPSQRGFDFVGLNLPFTNVWECDLTHEFYRNFTDNKTLTQCFLYNNTEIVQQPIRFDDMTENLVSEWHRFLDERLRTDIDKKPFFFYFSFPHVHTTLFANSTNKGTSKRGLFGDNINEMAYAVGEVIGSLKANNLQNNTLVVFMSDHGPHVEMCDHGGTTIGLRGGKSNSFEGGFRIPFATWMPNTVRAGVVSDEVISSLDLFVTFQNRASSHLPQHGPGPKYCLDDPMEPDEETCKDGIDMWCELRGWKKHENCPSRKHTPEGRDSRSRPIFFYCNKNLMAIRYEEYKIHFATTRILRNFTTSPNFEGLCPGGIPKEDWYVDAYCPDDKLITLTYPELYDLGKDPFELFPLPLSDQNILKIYEKMFEIREKHRKSVVWVQSQLDHTDDTVVPCCDETAVPKCSCNKLQKPKQHFADPKENCATKNVCPKTKLGWNTNDNKETTAKFLSLILNNNNRDAYEIFKGALIS